MILEKSVGITSRRPSCANAARSFPLGDTAIFCMGPISSSSPSTCTPSSSRASTWSPTASSTSGLPDMTNCGSTTAMHRTCSSSATPGSASSRG
uniref:Uncharacterized protein n=1 Tax=Arundo donax TaxID=35708 RepID=A0A0A9G780_ARUDO